MEIFHWKIKILIKENSFILIKKKAETKVKSFYKFFAYDLSTLY